VPLANSSVSVVAGAKTVNTKSRMHLLCPAFFHLNHMKQHAINELLDVLKPVLKNRKRAKELLESKILVVTWTFDQVYRAANERGLAITKEEAIKVFQHLQFNYNPQYGIKWSDITDFIEDRVLGRKLNRREIWNFVHQDIITIHKT
jgi:hypothetical protein